MLSYLHATVKGAADGLSRLVGDGALGSGHGEGSTLCDAVEVEGLRSSWASSNGGCEGDNGRSGSESELHDGWEKGVTFTKVLVDSKRMKRMSGCFDQEENEWTGSEEMGQ